MAAVLPLVLHKHQKMNDRKPLARDVDPIPNQSLSALIVGLLGLQLTPVPGVVSSCHLALSQDP